MSGVSARSVLMGFGLAGLLAACTTQAPPAPAPTAALPAADSKAQVTAAPSTGAAPTTAAAVPKAASPSPAAVAKIEPKGSVTLAFHSNLVPQWFDPQENPALTTPYLLDYLIHDSVVKSMPGNPFTPSLAESYELAPDFKSATFKLRPNIKFHNGEPVTAEDVKFTFEKYRGANAKLMQDKTASIETPDPRTVKFTFKEPFLDFLVLYGTPSSGAGWVVPKKYYEQVGPDGYKLKPIGAGPFKFVSATQGNIFETEAFTDYWRHAPYLKTFIIKTIPEEATRAAALKTGEVDLMTQAGGQVLDPIRNDPNLKIALTPCCSFWLTFPGLGRPDNPFNDLRVRQAIDLALDRKAIADAESFGLSPIEGNWIPEDYPGATKFQPQPYDIERAKKLMADAGLPNGFDAGSITPFPPYNSISERVMTALRPLGIQLKLNAMERGAFTQKATEGENAFGKGIVLWLSGASGDAASRFRVFGICPPKGVNSFMCDPTIDAKFAQYEASANKSERDRLLAELQQYVYDNHIFITLYKQVGVAAQGPKIANDPKEIWGSVLQYSFVAPYEDVRIKG